MDKTDMFATHMNRLFDTVSVRNSNYFAIHSKIYRKIVAKTYGALYNMNKYFLGVKICN